MQTACAVAKSAAAYGQENQRRLALESHPMHGTHTSPPPPPENPTYPGLYEGVPYYDPLRGGAILRPTAV